MTMPPGMKTRVALFGTSADPPHNGHRSIVATLGHQFDYVAVWASDNPWKTDQSPISMRMDMLGLAIDELDTPGTVKLHPELSHPYTAVTLERARRIWPEAEFTFVIGADLIEQLPRWHRSADVMRWAKILVFPRPGYMLQETDLAELRALGAEVAIATPLSQHHISSSALRQSRPQHPDEIPAVVQAYISHNNLYPCPENIPTTP
ncbi:nicotinate-nucleotide adenylyltransferase [Leptolyngbya cf. ectocarpi LEGE 11479]|uniref:Probable nicotinate-nucleotide adenylyltransferase n=1 Tax=Leptolyngbya cf. ectocarpi LEGE 11479 TaxID=1828722 RepID=A0A928ZVU1_LEPEC|nr:nicotinate-nucleotide adenylyltransferase [Leptolyngbya ectocarpi]MBE9068417.1 nicotinate-nucleotide adenylyltransferase [Leptolyngbya cf. ectocarpi LEGE 11479]